VEDWPMKRGWRIAISSVAAVISAVLLIAVAFGSNGRDMVQYVAAAILYGVSDGGAATECNRLREVFLRQHEIPKNSKSVPGQPAIFCNAGSSGIVFKVPTTFIIYGAVDKAIQDQYLNALDSILRTNGPHDLRVEFYEQENWVEWKSAATGASGGDRGPERLLRAETLTH
jgi:hypothetical protein